MLQSSGRSEFLYVRTVGDYNRIDIANSDACIWFVKNASTSCPNTSYVGRSLRYFDAACMATSEEKLKCARGVIVVDAAGAMCCADGLLLGDAAAAGMCCRYFGTGDGGKDPQ